MKHPATLFRAGPAYHPDNDMRCTVEEASVMFLGLIGKRGKRVERVERGKRGKRKDMMEERGKGGAGNKGKVKGGK